MDLLTDCLVFGLTVAFISFFPLNFYYSYHDGCRYTYICLIGTIVYLVLFSTIVALGYFYGNQSPGSVIEARLTMDRHDIINLMPDAKRTGEERYGKLPSRKVTILSHARPQPLPGEDWYSRCKFQDSLCSRDRDHKYFRSYSNPPPEFPPVHLSTQEEILRKLQAPLADAEVLVKRRKKMKLYPKGTHHKGTKAGKGTRTGELSFW